MKLSRSILRLVLALVPAAIVTASATPAHAFAQPNSGDWSFYLHQDVFANGSNVECANMAPGSQTCHITDLRLVSFNDEASSYTVCNNTGTTRSFYLGIYSNASYNDLIVFNVLSVPSGVCYSEDIPSAYNDTASSFTITAS